MLDLNVHIWMDTGNRYFKNLSMEKSLGQLTKTKRITQIGCMNFNTLFFINTFYEFYLSSVTSWIKQFSS